ncbi:MAG: hypothetical protein HY608_08485 [Planctomycetes bacterium]|nr:hypothetical protein [Planctomycetota bacterium]
MRAWTILGALALPAAALAGPILDESQTRGAAGAPAAQAPQGQTAAPTIAPAWRIDIDAARAEALAASRPCVLALHIDSRAL